MNEKISRIINKYADFNRNCYNPFLVNSFPQASAESIETLWNFLHKLDSFYDFFYNKPQNLPYGDVFYPNPRDQIRAQLSLIQYYIKVFTSKLQNEATNS